MTDIYPLLLALIAAGCFDRLRGDAFDLLHLGKGFEAALYGLAVAVCLGSPVWWTTPLFIGLWVAGSSFGWGEPLGAALTGRRMNLTRLERWQFGWFALNPWAALALRGLIWGACCLPLALADPRYLFALGMTAIMPLSAWWARKFPAVGNWETQEYLRGFLIAGLALAVRAAA